MSYVTASFRSVAGRYRLDDRSRATGLALAAAAEALLVLLVLTLGSNLVRRDRVVPIATVVALHAADDQAPSNSPSDKVAIHKPKLEPEHRSATAQPKAASQHQPSVTLPSHPAEQVPTFIHLSPKEVASADISSKSPSPAAPASRPMMGPPNVGYTIADTPRVSGSGPHGEPLYAAAWYRKPYDDELRGYLSTATAPSWALIECKTVPNYRVEDCVKLDEYPEGSNIARAVLAAAWQFQVRPPRIGGEPQVGAWVRIRFDYGTDRQIEER